jgi:hypothetical protein
MDELVFEGLVVKGHGWFADMVVPGREKLAEAPPDWPEVLEPGSLNLKVLSYPAEFEAHGLRATVTELDRLRFRPVLVIPREAIIGNRLRAEEGQLSKGVAQVWRARFECAGGSLNCWVMRRIGSGYTDRLEVVASVVPLR